MVCGCHQRTFLTLLFNKKKKTAQALIKWIRQIKKVVCKWSETLKLDTTHRCGKKRNKNILAHSATETFIWPCASIICLFLFLFFTPSGVFMKLCVSKLSHSARPFLFLLSFLSSEAIFLYFSFHHILHLIYHIRESSNLFKSITAMRKTCKKSLIICKFHDYFLILQPMKRVRPKKIFGQHFLIDLNIA